MVYTDPAPFFAFHLPAIPDSCQGIIITKQLFNALRFPGQLFSESREMLLKVKVCEIMRVLTSLLADYIMIGKRMWL
jgi:hypothetical protein